jgi:hypothetical protein
MTYIRDKVDKDGDSVDRRYYCSQWCYENSLTEQPPETPVESQMAMAGGKAIPKMFLEEGGSWPGYESDYPVTCAKCDEWIDITLTAAGIGATQILYHEAAPDERNRLKQAYPFLND